MQGTICEKVINYYINYHCKFYNAVKASGLVVAGLWRIKRLKTSLSSFACAHVREATPQIIGFVF